MIDLKTAPRSLPMFLARIVLPVTIPRISLTCSPGIESVVVVGILLFIFPPFNFIFFSVENY